MKLPTMKRIMSLIFLPLILSACVQTKSSVPAEVKREDSEMDTDSGIVLTVSMTEFKFTPETYSVPAGSVVTLQLSNDGKANHNWVLMEFEYIAGAPYDNEDEGHELFNFILRPGENNTFTFTAPSVPGEYQVVCTFPGHLARGMKATLTVTEAERS
jgi:uncharacterized cupredoxin-like copper-binding protein